ncbi:MAG: GNAT family N-acetyltransferase [Chloroflexota bacterium]
MDIRKAKPKDAARLTQIAFAAKAYWGYPASWIALWRDTLTITPEYIATVEVYTAVVGGEIVGFYALIGAGEKLTLNDLWVLPEMIGQGIGRVLFEHACHHAKTLGAEILEIEADPNTEGFYQHMGAQRVGEHLSEIEGQPRILPVFHLRWQTSED